MGDFGASLKEVIATYAPERILIEPSGVGKLSDVLRAVENVASDLDVQVYSASFRKPPSMPISPNSFSMRTVLLPSRVSFKSFLIRVVFPAPKKPENWWMPLRRKCILRILENFLSIRSNMQELFF